MTTSCGTIFSVFEILFTRSIPFRTDLFLDGFHSDQRYPAAQRQPRVGNVTFSIMMMMGGSSWNRWMPTAVGNSPAHNLLPRFGVEEHFGLRGSILHVLIISV